MNTAMLLMAQYEGRPVIPLETVVTDYFPHLTLPMFLRKISLGEIRLPIIRIEGSQKAARGVHLEDLAYYIDARREDAHHELMIFLRPR